MAVTESIRVRTGRSAPPEWFWRVAPLAAAAIAAAIYLVLAPKTGDLPAHVFRRSCSGATASRSGTATGTAGITPPVTACCSPRSPGCWARRWPRARRPRGDRGVRATGPSPLGSKGRWGASVRHRHLVDAAERSAAVRARRGHRAGLAAGPSARPQAVGGPARGALLARQPGGRLLPCAGGDRLLAEQSLARAVDRGRRQASRRRS